MMIVAYRGTDAQGARIAAVMCVRCQHVQHVREGDAQARKAQPCPACRR